MPKPDEIDHVPPVLLVTGAARRIGAATVVRFHQQGFNVIIHYNSSSEDAYALQTRLNHIRPDSAALIQGNLNDTGCHQQLGEKALNCFGRLDVLVNNASSFYATEFGTASGEDWDNLFGSNVKAAFFLSQQLAAELTANSGAIVNIADIHANSPLPGFSIYSMAKAAVQAMTKSLAKELAPAVRVNGVAPGAILWPDSIADSDIEKKQNMLDQIPLGRLGEPENIADTVFFLATTATYMTGTVIKVDGGKSLS